LSDEHNAIGEDVAICRDWSSNSKFPTYLPITRINW